LATSCFFYAIFQTMNNNQPIGIFDSGIGGLTVANAIKKALPNESIIYFGDTKHLPYGEKSSRAINEYSKKICDFLIKKNCKMIVIACNTASSVAYQNIKESCPDTTIVNVIDPVVRYLSKETNSKKVGIIGTKGTINSGVYSKKIKEKNPNTEVSTLATPLLAPMIEEGFINDTISQTVINNYLENPALKGIEKIILACTHYPLIENIVKKFYNNKVEVIDSASQVANYVLHSLETGNLKSDQQPEYRFYVSDYTDSFEQSAKFFFNENIHLEEVIL